MDNNRRDRSARTASKTLPTSLMPASSDDVIRKPPARRGFAAMDPEMRRAIARKGGESVPPEKRSFSRNRELAQSAGRKGGLNMSQAQRASDPELGADAGTRAGRTSRAAATKSPDDAGQPRQKRPTRHTTHSSTPALPG